MGEIASVLLKLFINRNEKCHHDIYWLIQYFDQNMTTPHHPKDTISITSLRVKKNKTHHSNYVSYQNMNS